MNRHLLLSLCAVALFVIPAFSQTGLDSDIQNLQKQVQMWEAIVQNPNAPADQQALNQRRLYDRRNELLSLLNRKISELQLMSNGVEVTEKQPITETLRRMNALRTDVLASLGRRGEQPVVQPRAVELPPTKTRPAVVFEPIRQGATVIKGSSIQTVAEVVVEIRTFGRSTLDSKASEFSHANESRGELETVRYRVVRSPGSHDGPWRFTVPLTTALTANQQVRAIPDGDRSATTAWLAVSSVTDYSPVVSNAAVDVEPNGREASLASRTDLSIRSRRVADQSGSRQQGGGGQQSGSGQQGGSGQQKGSGQQRGREQQGGSGQQAGSGQQSGGGQQGGRGAQTGGDQQGATQGSGDRSSIETPPTPFTRGIVGIEQAAAASANPEQKLFLEFNIDVPIFRRQTDDHGHEINRPAIDAPLWLWLNPRITSLPQQVSSSVAEFSTASNFFSPFTSGKVNDIVQGFEFLGGIEVPFPMNGRHVTAPIASGFGDNTKVRFGLSAVFGAGAITPFSPQKTLQVFKVNDTVVSRFPNAKGKEFVAFVSGDRNRFFRQYYAGLRLKSYYVRGDDVDKLESIFPGIIDFTVGQNEAITGGKLRGAIVRLDGIYPLPFIKGEKKGAIYAFGSALMKLSHAKTIAPVILQLPDSGANVQVPGSNVDLETVPLEDRDHYRIGVGVDLIRLIRGGSGAKPSGSGATPKSN